MEFNSVREINLACDRAYWGTLGGKYVYARVAQKDKTTRLLRISKARNNKGKFQVRLMHQGCWYTCQISDVLAQ